MQIYLTGQNNFGNRGCEALVRSTVLAVREVFPAATFLVPSGDIARDSAQWPDADDQGVKFAQVAPVPVLINKWGGLALRAPALTRGPWPRLSQQSMDAKYVRDADIVLSIGGDNYSLDYGIASLAYFVAVAELAMAAGKPVALWGASVGPFSAVRAVESHMAAHLRRLSMVSVRETRSTTYLKSIGVFDNVVPVCDTAFLMCPEPMDVESFWPRVPGAGAVGLNISWLMQRIRTREGQAGDVTQEAIEFVRQVLRDSDFSVLLVPHVAPLDGAALNSDDRMNAIILAGIGADSSGRVNAVPPGLNAAQLKYVISQCRFLIAARTHATIAAFSTGVPTISLAYSVKARGINHDLFGHERFVLDTRDVSRDTLWESLRRLEQEEPQIRDHYARSVDGWRLLARAGAQRLQGLAA